jgi:YspA, cpYpsA-related SLOG family
MKLLVCGGQDYQDIGYLFRTLDAINAVYSVSVLATGACRRGGADEHAEQWAKSRQVNYRGYPAKWRVLGKRAGPVRNGFMLSDFVPDAVAAFPGGTGTTDMVARAREAGVVTWMFPRDEEVFKL